jgi:hypothetical protein
MRLRSAAPIEISPEAALWIGFYSIEPARDTLWQAMCAEWAKRTPDSEANRISQVIEDALT